MATTDSVAKDFKYYNKWHTHSIKQDAMARALKDLSHKHCEIYALEDSILIEKQEWIQKLWRKGDENTG